MNNKILVKILVPEINEIYEMFIPVNEKVKTLVLLIKNIVVNLTHEDLLQKRNYVLMNASTTEVYNNEVVLRETNIKNTTNLVLV